MSNSGRRSSEDVQDEGRDHLDDLPDGAGCYEIWEHLSETRERVACD